MELRQLRSLVALVESNFSVSRAAARLNLVQPAVSQHLKQVEEELGARLFRRHGKRLVGLTDAGEKVVHYARRTLADTANILAIGRGARALGMVPNMDYTETVIALEQGDTMVLYTDGITEATAADGREYSREGLVDAVRDGQGTTAERLLAAIVTDVHRHAAIQSDEPATALTDDDEASLSDDLTLIVLRRRP